MVPAVLLGLFMGHQLNWVKLFSDQLWVEALLILGATSFGMLMGWWVRRRLNLLLVGLIIFPMMWFLGQQTLLYLVEITYFSWDLVLVTALLGGLMAIHFRADGAFSLVELPMLIVGFLAAFYLPNADYLFAVIFLIISLTARRLKPFMKIIPIGLVVLALLGLKSPDILPGQSKYEDHLVAQDKTRKSRLDVTRWQNQYWYYVNGQNRINSLDHWLYHEPLVHPVMTARRPQNVLILGGESGGAMQEVLKYKYQPAITLVPEDYELLLLFLESNNDRPKEVMPMDHVEIENKSIWKFMATDTSRFDVIIVDLPDPTNLEYNQYYTVEFYKLCREKLSTGGYLITQAGSPYFATKAYYAIGKTMRNAGFDVVPLHNQVLTLGEWGWFVGSMDQSADGLKETLKALDFGDVETTWLNQEAMKMMMAFGKVTVDTSGMEVNRLVHPVIHEYYTTGNWIFK